MDGSCFVPTGPASTTAAGAMRSPVQRKDKDFEGMFGSTSKSSLSRNARRTPSIRTQAYTTATPETAPMDNLVKSSPTMDNLTGASMDNLTGPSVDTLEKAIIAPNPKGINWPSKEEVWIPHRIV